jgi:hypothetical protein
MKHIYSPTPNMLRMLCDRAGTPPHAGWWMHMCTKPMHASCTHAGRTHCMFGCTRVVRTCIDSHRAQLDSQAHRPSGQATTTRHFKPSSASMPRTLLRSGTDTKQWRHAYHSMAYIHPDFIDTHSKQHAYERAYTPVFIPSTNLMVII